MKRVIPFIFSVVFSISFSSYAQETTKMQQVIVLHDEVMDKMPQLVKIINQLQPRVDSTETGEKYQIAINNLKKSNTSMMTWMQGFGSRFTSEEMLKGKALSEQKQLWVIEELEKVKALKKEINTSIEKANLLLVK